MNKRKGWHFPPNGGDSDGFNDSGIETYAGKPFMSLAREVLQNSLDAKADKQGKVVVTFEKMDIPVEDLPDRDGLHRVFSLCKKQAAKDKDESALAFFTRGVRTLEKGKVSCLKIDDYNTTGLRGGDTADDKGQWFALTRARGTSAKKDKMAGGSYGIGKHATFAVSDLRTVFYYTHYLENKKPCERARGRAILISHAGKDGETVGTGFYGYGDDYASITEGNEIPTFLRRTIKSPEHDEGTTVMVMGLKESKNWHNRIIAAVIANFFYAIDNKQLEVVIDYGEDTILINDMTLPDLLASSLYQAEDIAVKNAYFYYLALKEGNLLDKTVSGLGHSKLWTKVGSDFPQNVAIIRNTGMLITDNMQGLRRWTGCEEFAAVCLCSSNDGNALLRSMENPQHDAFEPERLEGKSEQSKGETALKNLARWVRDGVSKFASASQSQTDNIVELAEWFNDPDAPDPPLPGEDGERNFEGNSIEEFQSIKSLSPPETISEEGENGDEDDDTKPINGNGGKRKHKKKTAARRALKVSAVRILPQGDNVKRVMFTPMETGRARLGLLVAGDSFIEPIGIQAVVKNGKKETMTGGGVKMEVVAKKRVEVDVVLAEATEDALCISLTEDATKKQGA